MKTKYGHTVADESIILAENSNFCVWKWEGWYYLSGLGETQFVFTNESQWDELASVIIKATKNIKEGVKE